MRERTPLLPAYAILGADAPRVQRSLRRLRQRIVEESGSDLNVVELDAAALETGRGDPGELLTAIAQPGLVLGHRAVIVLNADKLKAATKTDLVAALQDMPPDTTVAFVAAGLAKNDKLLKVVASIGDVLRFDLPSRREYPEWLGKRAREHGLHLSVHEARHLARLVGDDAWRLDSELGKLAAYVGARSSRDPVTVSAEDIDAVCTPSLDVQIWDLTDAVGRRDSAAAFRALEELLAGGDQRRSRGDPLRGILTTLSRHLADLRRVHALRTRDPERAATELQIHPFRARKLVEQAAQFPVTLIDRALMALAAADADMVGGSQLPPQMVLEVALAEILRARS